MIITPVFSHNIQNCCHDKGLFIDLSQFSSVISASIMIQSHNEGNCVTTVQHPSLA